LIGRSLSHSFSKTYFTERFQIEGIAATYENIEVLEPNDLNYVLEQDFKGMNVTIPYKQAIMPLLRHIDKEAEEVGAVNCITKRDGEWHGFNTDIYGFKESMRPILKSYHRKALILGTGGASKAVAHVLKEIGLDFKFVSRHPEGNELSYQELNANALKFYPLIINTTPLGTYPDVTSFPELPYEAMTELNLAYDLVYNPEVTEFLRRSAAQGAQVMNGKKMLIYQAERSWEIWNEVK
jgi:shikimate dehydrogenase